MRPLELRLRGFRSYDSKTEKAFDFRGRHLVGIVGPIGSGKSSILDAVSFALYGRTHSVTRDTKSLIHQRSDGATVALRFEVEGDVWQVIRALRRKGQSQHALYAYDSDADAPATLETVTGERDVNARVAELLGMDFDAFGRSVLLAQGEFDRFLSSPPVERDKVLKGVFGYDRIDRMREAAREHARGADLDVEKVMVRLADLDRLGADLDERRLQLETLATDVARLEAARPRLAGLDSQIAEGEKEALATGSRLQELAGVADRIPKPEQFAGLVDAARAAAAERSRLAEALEKAEEARATAESRLRTAEEGGERRLLERTGKLIAALQPQRAALADAGRRRDSALGRHEALVEQHQRSLVRQQAATGAATAAAGSLAAAEAALAGAEQALHGARHAEMALTLRGELVAGADCPVCAQRVEAVPPPGDTVALEDAEGTVAERRQERAAAVGADQKAAAELQAATEAVIAAERSVLEAEAAVAEASGEVEAATKTVGDAVAELRDVLGDGDPEKIMADRQAALTVLEDAVAAARVGALSVRELHDEAIAAEQASSRRLSELTVTLAGVAARLGDETPIPAEDPAALAQAVERLRRLWTESTADLETRRASAEALSREAAASRRTLLEELGVKGEFAAAVARAQAELDQRAGSITQDEERVAGRAAVLAEHAAAEGRRDVLERLSSDLTDSRFIRYLLEEERARLADLGSDHFQRLSGGRYRFTDDGGFAVVDLTAAEATRKSDSLSGGETFLASLALAIGLAEMVARSGGRLDAFFLDEGFGSLDPEHLDLAMEGVEALVAENDDRLVVVVSHVPEMRQRLEDLIVLDRDPVTGDTIVRRGAGAA